MTNEHNVNTIRMIGKKLFGYSTHQGSLYSAARRFFKKKISNNQILPVNNSKTNKIKGKFIELPLNNHY